MTNKANVEIKDFEYKMEMDYQEIKDDVIQKLEFVKHYGNKASESIDIEKIEAELDGFHMMRLFRFFGINNRIIVNLIIDSFIDGIEVGAGVYFEDDEDGGNEPVE